MRGPTAAQKRRPESKTPEIPPLGYASVGMTHGGAGPKTLAARMARKYISLAFPLRLPDNTGQRQRRF